MRRAISIAATAGLAAAAGAAGPEHTVVLIDPSSAASMHVGNHYRMMRQIPERNVLYMDPGASDYQAFVDENLDALFGTLAHRGLDAQIDVVVVTPGTSFFVSVQPGLVDPAGCPAPISRFSISGAYTTAFISDEVLAGTERATRFNGYYGGGPFNARPFDSQTPWAFGEPDKDVGDRYMLSAMLGYTGNRGNSVGEIIDLIDRSVMADGSQPSGTFYYQTTNDQARSGPRDGGYDSAVSAIQSLGGSAVNQNGVLPGGSQDILGIMTGAANPNVDGANLGILPGAFCDHLTSWAATFNRSAQTKVSAWIAGGASGSWGTVEEPCNFALKFPHPILHPQYFQGLTLGEAAFRAAGYVPFQGLLYGDPLTRPFAAIPEVSIEGLPEGPTDAGTIQIQTEGTPGPGLSMDEFRLYVDGVRTATAQPGESLTLSTGGLSDGWHEIRVEGIDSSDAEVPGTAFDDLMIDRSTDRARLEGLTTAGDLSTALEFEALSDGQDVIETRLVQNGRVIAAADGCTERFSVPGASIGAGASAVRAEALLADGTRVSSVPLVVDVAADGFDASDDPPRAVSHTKVVSGAEPLLLELPALSDDDPADLSFEILDGPAQASLTSGGDSGYRILRPDPGASGADRITYRVTSPDGTSEPAEVTVLYDAFPVDRDGDGDLDIDDLHRLTRDPADVNLDGAADAADQAFLRRVLRCGERRDMRGGRR